MNIKNLLVAAVAAATLFVAAPVANAQGQGQGRGQGGGMRMMQGGRGGSMFLLRRNDVKKDLKLTDDQKSKLDALQEKIQSEMREMFQNGGAGGDREAMMKAMQEKQTGWQKEADAVLTPEQKARLEQINVQIQGNSIILDPKYQEKLKVSEDQKTKIKDLQSKQQEASRSLMEKMRNQEMDREEAMQAMTKNRDAMNGELGKLLTDEQKKMIADWSGPKFDRNPEDDQIRFGGGR